MGSDHLRRFPSQAEPNVFIELLQYLLANKAPANDYNDWGEYVAIAPLGSACFVVLLTCLVQCADRFHVFVPLLCRYHRSDILCCYGAYSSKQHRE